MYQVGENQACGQDTQGRTVFQPFAWCGCRSSTFAGNRPCQRKIVCESGTTPLMSNRDADMAALAAINMAAGEERVSITRDGENVVGPLQPLNALAQDTSGRTL